ncbi:hypothetical protein ABQF08_19585, partial [Xanthomonas campestris pv. campestris]
SSGTPLQTSRPCGRWVIGGFSGATLYTLVLLAPCIAIIPGAIETRFFLPIHCLSYCALAFGGIKKEAIAMQLACTAILTAAIFTFAAKSADSPIHSRPESYIPTPSNI